MSGGDRTLPTFELLLDVHACLPSRPDDALCRGHYLYYHYGCDGVDDRGWGCGYRTLQTLCSWAKGQRLSAAASPPPPNTYPVPVLAHIQQALVAMGDKPKSFISSREWIGSVEACYILDHFFGVTCKMLHIESGSDIDQILPELYEHFQEYGSPVMMGGGADNSSKGIMGVRQTEPALLVVDPHFYGSKPTVEMLQSSGFVKWLPVRELHSRSFYNLCLPKLAAASCK